MKIGRGASSNCVLDTIINLHWNHHTLFLSLPVHMSKKHKSTPSAQEMKEQALLCRKKEELHAHFEHLLKQLVDSPDKYKRGEFRYIREFVTFIEGHRDDFPHVMGTSCMTQKFQQTTIGPTPPHRLDTSKLWRSAERTRQMHSPPQLSKSFIVKQNFDHRDLLTLRLKMGEKPIHRLRCNSLICLSVMATTIRCLVAWHVIIPRRQES